MLEYAMLTNATAAGAGVFSTKRGFTTPYTDTVTQVHNSAATLDPNNMSITITVDGQACNSDATCQTALAQGNQASVGVNYMFVPLIADGFVSMLMPTTITSRLNVRVQ